MNSNEEKKLDQVEEKLAPLTEFETKYLTNPNMLDKFKKIAESLPNLSNFQYAEGPDYFFENPNLPLTFVRFRRSAYPDESGEHYQQLTSKTKKTIGGSNIQRKEPNLMVKGSIKGSINEIMDFVRSVGFEYTHSIKKRCHIYYYPECTLVFYTVMENDESEPEHFVEIEIDEATIHNLTKTEALQIIEKYEEILSPIEGVSAKKRLRLSLRERYRKKA